MRRVVVTGLGVVSPLGCGVEPTWKRILGGESGARKIDTFDVSDLPSQIACLVPRGDGTDGTFNPNQWMEPKDQRKVDDFIIFAMSAARQALDDADWHPVDEADQCATGTLIGSGIGGLAGIAETAVLLKERGPRKVSPFFIPGRLINLASGYVSIEHGLKGPNHSVVTACSTGAHAIGDASRLIALGDADVMVAGGTESPICRIGMAGFCAARALSTGFNDAPERASRPYDRDRDGFVMGEGAAIVVLEEYEHARNRGARIYAEVAGYGLSGDAYHITSPSPDGDGGFRSMRAAMKRAGISASDIDVYQRTRNLDAGRRRNRTGSRRAAIGQRGFQGFDVLDQVVDGTPPRRGWRDRSDFQYSGNSLTMWPRRPSTWKTRRCKPRSTSIPQTPRKREINVALSNSFGFGGTNASVILQRVAE